MESIVQEFIDRNGATSSETVGVLEMLARLLKNIIMHKKDAKYMTIKTSNPRIRAALLLDGNSEVKALVARLVQAVGFHVSVEQFTMGSAVPMHQLENHATTLTAYAQSLDILSVPEILDRCESRVLEPEEDEATKKRKAAEEQQRVKEQHKQLEALRAQRHAKFNERQPSNTVFSSWFGGETAQPRTQTSNGYTLVENCDSAATTPRPPASSWMSSLFGGQQNTGRPRTMTIRDLPPLPKKG